MKADNEYDRFDDNSTRDAYDIDAISRFRGDVMMFSIEVVLVRTRVDGQIKVTLLSHSKNIARDGIELLSPCIFYYDVQLSPRLYLLEIVLKEKRKRKITTVSLILYF